MDPDTLELVLLAIPVPLAGTNNSLDMLPLVAAAMVATNSPPHSLLSRILDMETLTSRRRRREWTVDFPTLRTTNLRTFTLDQT